MDGPCTFRPRTKESRIRRGSVSADGVPGVEHYLTSPPLSRHNVVDADFVPARGGRRLGCREMVVRSMVQGLSRLPEGSADY